MNTVSIRLVLILLMYLFPMGTPSVRAADDHLLEGYDFKRLEKPMPTVSGSKVEVIEFFRYGCPHCNAMAPLIEPWAERRKADVMLVRIPFNRGDTGVAHQHLYYALEALGQVERLQLAIFRAIHDERQPMDTPEAMADYLAEKGVDRQRFMKAYRSAKVKAKVEKAQALVKAYGVESVPTLFVDGRHMTSAVFIQGSQQDALHVVDQLVNRVKTERRTKTGQPIRH